MIAINLRDPARFHSDKVQCLECKENGIIHFLDGTLGLGQHLKHKHKGMKRIDYAKKFNTEEWATCPVCGAKYFRHIRNINANTKTSCGKKECVKEMRSFEKSSLYWFGVGHVSQLDSYKKIQSEKMKEIRAKEIYSEKDKDYWKDRGFISKIEDRFFEYLLLFFDKDDIKRQRYYRSDFLKKSYKVDFYIKSQDLWIQFDGIYWHALERFSARKTHKKERDRELNHEASIGNLNLIRITDSSFSLFEANKITEPQFYCMHIR